MRCGNPNTQNNVMVIWMVMYPDKTITVVHWPDHWQQIK